MSGEKRFRPMSRGWAFEGVVAMVWGGLRMGVRGVVRSISICIWPFVSMVGVTGSIRGFLEQFAAVQARIRASLLVSRMAFFSDLVFGPR
jgi:vacuolar-type H+-ATPase subunit I/STV1